jgi:hypothetical protein
MTSMTCSTPVLMKLAHNPSLHCQSQILFICQGARLVSNYSVIKVDFHYKEDSTVI